MDQALLEAVNTLINTRLTLNLNTRSIARTVFTADIIHNFNWANIKSTTSSAVITKSYEIFLSISSCQNL